jgi:predicted transcriptional regulator
MGGGKALESVGGYLKKKGILKQTGATSGQITTAIQKNKIPRVGKFLEEEGLMRPGKSTADVAEKTAEIIKEEAPKIGTIYENAQQTLQALREAGKEAPKIDAIKLADNLVSETKKKFRTHADREEIVRNIESAANILREFGDNADLRDIHTFRQSLDSNVSWAKSSQQRSGVETAYANARDIVDKDAKKVLDQLDNMLGGTRGKDLRASNSRFSTAKDINQISTQATGRELGKVLGGGIINAGSGLGAGATAAGISLYNDPEHNPVRALMQGLAYGVPVGASMWAGRKFAAPLAYQTGKAAQYVGKKAPYIPPTAVIPWTLLNKNEEK